MQRRSGLWIETGQASLQESDRKAKSQTEGREQWNQIFGPLLCNPSDSLQKEILSIKQEILSMIGGKNSRGLAFASKERLALLRGRALDEIPLCVLSSQWPEEIGPNEIETWSGEEFVALAKEAGLKLPEGQSAWKDVTQIAEHLIESYNNRDSGKKTDLVWWICFHACSQTSVLYRTLANLALGSQGVWTTERAPYSEAPHFCVRSHFPPEIYFDPDTWAYRELCDDCLPRGSSPYQLWSLFVGSDGKNVVPLKK